jgi:hypothetical protein
MLAATCYLVARLAMTAHHWLLHAPNESGSTALASCFVHKAWQKIALAVQGQAIKLDCFS